MQKKSPCPDLLEFPRARGRGQAPFWGRLATHPTTEKPRSQNHEVPQTPRFPERQKWPSVKGPWAAPEVPEIHQRQCKPSKRMLFSVPLSLIAAGNAILSPSHPCRPIWAEHLGCALVIACNWASSLNIPTTYTPLSPQLLHVDLSNHG